MTPEQAQRLKEDFYIRISVSLLVILLIGIAFLLKFDLSEVHVVFAFAALEFVLNGFYWFYVRPRRRFEQLTNFILIFTDTGLIFSSLYATGGFESDLIFLLVLPILVGWYQLDRLRVFWHTISGIFFYLALTYLAVVTSDAIVLEAVPISVFVLTSGLIALSGIHLVLTEQKHGRALNAELTDRLEEVRVFYALSHLFVPHLEPDKALGTIAEGAARMLKAQKTAVFLYEDRQKSLRFAASFGMRQNHDGQKITSPIDVLYATFTTGTPLLVNDIPALKRRLPDFLAAEEIKNFILVPIRPGTEPLGIFLAANREGGFTHDHLQALYVLARQTGMIIHNAGLYQESEHKILQLEQSVAALEQNKKITLSIMDDLQREKINAVRLSEENEQLLAQTRERLNELFVLHQIARTATNITEYDRALEQAVGVIRSAFKAKAVALLLLDAERKAMIIKSYAGLSGGFVNFVNREGKLKIANVPAGKAFTEKKPVIIEEVEKDPLTKPYRDWAEKEGWISEVNVPMILGDEPLGVIKVMFGERHPIGSVKIGPLQTIANELSVLIGNANLYHQSEVDKAKDEAVLANISDGLIVADTGGVISYTNKATERMLGWSAAELVGKKAAAFLPSITERSVCRHETCLPFLCLKTGRGYAARDVLLHTKEGREIFVDLRVAPNQLFGGSIVGAIIVFNDVTEQYKLEEQKEEFFSVTSHQFRTPLTAIKGNLEMILSGSVASYPPELTEYLSDSLEATEQLLHLSRDVINISHLEGGRIDFKSRSFDVSAVVAEAGKLLKGLAERNKIKLSYPLKSRKKITAFGDPEKVQEVVTNLVGNAMKFTPEKGSITITAREKGDVVIVSVKDTGFGIRKEDMGKLFKKFSQVDSALSSYRGGTGLGLYISKLYVERMGGQIWAESEYKKGSTFSFSLPKKEPTLERIESVVGTRGAGKTEK